MRINSILILAAGRGTRLKPFTDHLPKSLLRQIGSSLRSQAIQVDPQREIRRVPSISIWLRIRVLSIAGKR